MTDSLYIWMFAISAGVIIGILVQFLYQVIRLRISKKPGVVNMRFDIWLFLALVFLLVWSGFKIGVF